MMCGGAFLPIAATSTHAFAVAFAPLPPRPHRHRDDSVTSSALGGARARASGCPARLLAHLRGAHVLRVFVAMKGLPKLVPAAASLASLIVFAVRMRCECSLQEES
eukprot:365160-Chlamydomonas_euryale.AAC.4